MNRSARCRSSCGARSRASSSTACRRCCCRRRSGWSGEGYVSPQDLDKTLKDGLGLRWSFMGPFETIELNAPGGIADYCARYGPSLSRLSAADPAIYQGENLKRILSQWQPLNSDQVAAQMHWRDRRLAALKAHKRSTAGTEVSVSTRIIIDKKLLQSAPGSADIDQIAVANKPNGDGRRGDASRKHFSRGAEFEGNASCLITAARSVPTSSNTCSQRRYNAHAIDIS